MATKQQRSEETRQALLKSGSKVFASLPFDKARIADVHDPLGLSQGAFYFHFDSKRELALEIIRREHETMVRLSERVLATTDDGLSGLSKLSLELAKLIRKDVTVQAGLRLTSQSPEEFPDFLGSSFIIWEVTITKFLERARDQATILPSVDLDAAAQYFVATFLGVQQLSAITTKWKDIEDRIQTASVFAIRSIATDKALKAIEERALVGAGIPR